MKKLLRYARGKTVLIIVLFLSFCSELSAQQSKDFLNPFKNSTIPRHDIVVLDVFYSGWDRPYEGRKPEWPSLGLGVNYMLDMPISKDRKWGIGLGLNYTWSTFRVDGEYQKDSLDQTQFIDISDNIKNTIHRHLFSIPLEIRAKFPIKNNNLIKVYLGYSLGWQFRTTQVSKINDDKSKDIMKDVFSEWQHGPHIRIGYNDVFLFMRYELNDFMYKQISKKPLRTFQIGLSFGG